MDIRIWLFIIVWHTMIILVCARNMNIATSHGLLHDQGQIMQSPGAPSAMKEGIENKAKDEEVLSRLGSRPPRCEHKCKGCTPCSPIQVPTVHLGPLYANYEPEDWKCKCGLSFYDP